jgi:hypothetical protein
MVVMGVEGGTATATVHELHIYIVMGDSIIYLLFYTSYSTPSNLHLSILVPTVHF